MTPRTLFNIILKVIGICLVEKMIPYLTGTFTMFINFFRDPGPGVTHPDIFNFILLLLSLAFYLALFYFLVFRTNAIINKLALDQDIQEKNIHITLHRTVVLSIVITVVGALVLVDQLPSFLAELYYYFGYQRKFTTIDVPPTHLIGSFITLLIAVLLIVYQRPLINLIELKKRKAGADDQHEESPPA